MLNLKASHKIMVNVMHFTDTGQVYYTCYCDCQKPFYFIQVIIWKETSNGWAKLQEFCNHDSSGKQNRFRQLVSQSVIQTDCQTYNTDNTSKNTEGLVKFDSYDV